MRENSKETRFEQKRLSMFSWIIELLKPQTIYANEKSKPLKHYFRFMKFACQSKAMVYKLPFKKYNKNRPKDN